MVAQVGALEAGEEKVVTEMKIRLTNIATVGCYYVDEEGNPWSTFSLAGGTATCVTCGKPITGGYAKGRYGEETYHCAAHVTIVSADEHDRPAAEHRRRSR